MTLQQQAHKSGLAVEDKQWNEADWPPLQGGWCSDHATVVLQPSDHDHHNNTRSVVVVVLGGIFHGAGATNSVLVLDLNHHKQQSWRTGPAMNQRRDAPAAVMCRGGVYVLGGFNGSSVLDCIERIDASD